MIFCTIAAANYLHKALYMARGLRKAHVDAKLLLCMPERTIPECRRLSHSSTSCAERTN